MNAKEKIINALFELISIKDFIEINVSEVCMIAKIHGTTFYAYYSNLFGLLEDAKNQAIEEFKKENNNGPLHLDNFKKQIFLNYLFFVKIMRHYLKLTLKTLLLLKQMKILILYSIKNYYQKLKINIITIIQ